MERMKDFPGRRIAATVVWLLGAYMTAVVITEMTGASGFAVIMGGAAFQLVLTFTQSRVWVGKGDLISYTALLIDAIVNFGGVFSIVVNIDKVGSVQALTITITGYSGDWPMWAKALVALGISAIIAGLPEKLWKEA
jgi:hypothetical protein